MRQWSHNSPVHHVFQLGVTRQLPCPHRQVNVGFIFPCHTLSPDLNPDRAILGQNSKTSFPASIKADTCGRINSILSEGMEQHPHAFHQPGDPLHVQMQHSNRNQWGSENILILTFYATQTSDHVTHTPHETCSRQKIFTIEE